MAKKLPKEQKHRNPQNLLVIVFLVVLGLVILLGGSALEVLSGRPANDFVFSVQGIGVVMVGAGVYLYFVTRKQ